MNNAEQQQEEVKDDFSDIEPCFHEVCRTYGREMFALVMNAGMAAEAAQRLAALAQKHASRQGVQAVAILGTSFNQVSNALAKAKGWEEGQLAQCQRDVERAFATRVQVVGGTGPIILTH